MGCSASRSEWLDACEAARVLDVPGPRNIRSLAARGLIGIRSLPGVRSIYRRVDVERLAASSVQNVSNK
jgi:hypothetical protein